MSDETLVWLETHRFKILTAWFGVLALPLAALTFYVPGIGLAVLMVLACLAITGTMLVVGFITVDLWIWCFSTTHLSMIEDTIKGLRIRNAVGTKDVPGHEG